MIGHSPGSSKIKFRDKSPTIKRLNVWLGACDVYLYSFTNLHASSVRFHRDVESDKIMLQECIKGYNKIITLGNEVSQYFKKEA